jgi:multidrug efflux pump subunit AcrA (membrane-fusion protein)
MKPQTWRWLAVSGLLLLGVGVTGLGFSRQVVWPWSIDRVLADASVNANRQRGLPVELMRVGILASPSQPTTLRGILMPLRATDLSFRRAGRIRRLEVAEGDRVVDGQVIAELDRADLDADRAQAIAEQASAKALLDELIAGPRKESIDAARAEAARLREMVTLRNLTLDRQRSLMGQNASSQQNLDEALHQAAMSEAEHASAKAVLAELEAGTRPETIAAQQGVVDRLQAKVQRLEVDISDTQIKAPFAGRVNRRLLDEGTIVSPGSIVFTLQEDHVLEARFGLPLRFADRLHQHDRVSLQVDSLSFFGTVVRLEPELDRRTRTRGLFVALTPEDSQRLFVGQLVTLLMEPDEPQDEGNDGYWVPTAALQRGNRGLWSVLAAVESPDGLVSERREVRILKNEGDLSLVSGMLAAGDQIVASGLHRVAVGAPLSPLTTLTENAVEPAEQR